MGVLQWFKRDKTGMSRQTNSRRSLKESKLTNKNLEASFSQSSTSTLHEGTVRTAKYRSDLAEFQARRNSFDSGLKKKSSRQSLPCTKCTTDSYSKSFPYERKVKSEQRPKTSEHPNIQLTFRNQVIIPGKGVYEAKCYTDQRKYERRKHKRQSSEGNHRDIIQSTGRKLSFDDEVPELTPMFFKNNFLPTNVKEFLDSPVSDKMVGTDSGQIANQNVENAAIGSPYKSKLDDSCESKINEVLAELHNFDQWADLQLKSKSPQSEKSELSLATEKSFQSVRVVSQCDVEMQPWSSDQWTRGKWGLLHVQVQKLPGISMKDLKNGHSTQFNILRKLRHPNILLLMGLFTNEDGFANLICERSRGTLFDHIHIETSTLPITRCVKNAFDICSALLYLKMQGYIHTRLWSGCIMVTDDVVCKISDFESCLVNSKNDVCDLTVFSPGIKGGLRPENEKQLAQPLSKYKSDPIFRWQAPECFDSYDQEIVFVSSKCDVYSLTCILWECCNSLKPFAKKSFEELHQHYQSKREGMSFPNDGTYPGSLLEIFQNGFVVDPSERCDLDVMCERLFSCYTQISKMVEPLVSDKVAKKITSPRWKVGSSNSSRMSSNNFDENSQLSHIYDNMDKFKMYENGNSQITNAISDTDHFKITRNTESSDKTPVVNNNDTSQISDEIDKTVSSFHDDFEFYDSVNRMKFDRSGIRSNCSTPKSKISKRKIGTPDLTLHKTDSTEYKSILSPESGDIAQKSSTATPKNYKSLKIKLPEVFALNEVRSLGGSGNDMRKRGNYNFDIKNYSLPTTPIARNNKILRNAWLSGESRDVVDEHRREEEEEEELPPTSASALLAYAPPKTCSNEAGLVTTQHKQLPEPLKPELLNLERVNSQSEMEKIADVSLAHVDVRPLVAQHERWISEANGSTNLKTQQVYRGPATAVKPASHCGPLPPSNLVANLKSRIRARSHNDLAPVCMRNNAVTMSESFNTTRDSLGRSMNFTNQDIEDGDKFNNFMLGQSTLKRDTMRRCTSSQSTVVSPEAISKRDNDTSTTTIDDFIKQMVRNELDCIIERLPFDIDRDAVVERGAKNVVDKLVANAVESDCTVKGFSQVSIKGNNKPLIEIRIDKVNNESVVKILDSCVTMSVNKGENGTLKRCQTYTSLQEARSTEDLYIDDDLASHVEETVAENMKVIPLHGSLHEILCEKQNECCLIKVQQESGCDNVYFMCNSPKNHMHDTVDGHFVSPVLLKRSISLIEETYECMPVAMCDCKNGMENNTLAVADNRSSSACSNDSAPPEDDEFEVLEMKIAVELKESNPNFGTLDKISEVSDDEDASSKQLSDRKSEHDDVD